MKNWWADVELRKTCKNFHCKYFGLYGCTHPNVLQCQNASLYWPWTVEEDKDYGFRHAFSSGAQQERS